MTAADPAGELCPHCGHSLRGPVVPPRDDDPPPADAEPRYYSEAIGVYVRGVYDGTLYWQCPACGGTWHRWPAGDGRHTAAAEHGVPHPGTCGKCGEPLTVVMDGDLVDCHQDDLCPAGGDR